MNKISETEWRPFYKMAGMHFISFRILYREFKILCNQRGEKNFYGHKRILYYHALRSVELLLKSFMIFKGESRTKVKKIFSHNIFNLFLNVDCYGLAFDSKVFMDCFL
jgi:hypothetical protein